MDNIFERFYAACCCGDFATVQEICGEMAPLGVLGYATQIDETLQYCTPFFAACANDHFDIVNFIISNIKSHSIDSLIGSVLYRCCYNCEPDMMKFLLERANNPDRLLHTLNHRADRNILMNICLNGRPDLLRVVLPFIKDLPRSLVRYSILWDLCCHDSAPTKCLKVLLDAPDVAKLITKKDDTHNRNVSIFHRCYTQGNIEMIKFFLESNITPPESGYMKCGIVPSWTMRQIDNLIRDYNDLTYVKGTF
jgi:hypothetical protein